MKVKKLITLLEILSVTCMVSVGFSSWLITDSPKVQVKGDIETYDIVNHNKYVSVSNMSISDYNNDGFYTDYVFSDGATNVCKVEFDMTMNYNLYMKDLYGYDTSSWKVNDFEFDVDLGYSKNLSYSNNAWSFFDLIGRSSASSTTGSYGIDSTPSTSLSITHTRNISVNNTSYSITTYDAKPSCNNVFSISNIPITAYYINIHLVYSFTIDNFNSGDYVGDYMNLLYIGIPFMVSFVVMEG